MTKPKFPDVGSFAKNQASINGSAEDEERTLTCKEPT
jgi:hypothetical protein